MPDLRRFHCLTAIVVLLFTTLPVAADLRTARSWGYQLQNIDVERIAGSAHDVVVIDYSRDGSDAGALTRAEVDRLKVKPGGGTRIVIAYMSVGEAEDYRFYWRSHWGWLWGIFAPSWRSTHNSEWSGNYAVRYWEDAWQNVIVGRGGYMERILAAGFDGVWLDKIDSSIEAVAQHRPSARADMVAFVGRIAATGRGARPGFLVIPQNGDELLTDAAYRRTIDAIGKEDLLYSEEADGKPNSEALIAARVERLGLLTAEGKPVLAVEYRDDASEIAAARARLEAFGFIPHFAGRSLSQMRLGDLPEPRATARK